MIELLVATSVLVILTVLLLNVVTHATNILHRSQDRSQLRENARLALDFIGSELKQAALPIDPQSTKVRFVVNPSGLPLDVFNRDAIFWQAPVATDSRLGDLAGIGYFVRKTGQTYTLCRALINPGDPLLEQSPALWPGAAPAIYDADPSNTYKGLFLENVLGLWANAYSESGTPYVPDSTSDHKLPPKFTISLVFLDKTGSTRLKEEAITLPDASAASDASAYVLLLPDSLKEHVIASQITVVFKNRKDGSLQ